MRPFEADAAEPSGDSRADSLSFTSSLTDFLVHPAAAAVGPELGPGARLGDVTIVRFVAEGGMGRVYEGLQGMPCRTVAVKVIRPGALSTAALKRFEYEAHVLGRLTHPGIARIYSMGTQPMTGGDVPYFVMEYIDEARPITAYATDNALPTAARLRLFREFCRAVAHGHQRGVIHRDLKPGNMLVDAAGQVKIIDFGIARTTEGDVALTSMLTDVGQLVGTVQYMCPEQFAGTADDLDVRADVYALGVVLYELLVGRLPYDVARRPMYAVARTVQEAEPTSLARINPQLRGDLETIVMKCLEKDRGRRYSSAAELEADLGRYLDGEPIAASPPRLRDAVVRLARRHKLATLAAAGLLTAIVAGGVGASIFAVQAARERATALREKARADVEARVSRQRLAIANLRSLQAAIGAGNLRLGRQLHAENLALAGGDPPLELRVFGADLDDALVVREWKRGPVRNVTYSPDGRILAATCVDDAPVRQVVDFKTLAHASAVAQSRRGELRFFHVGSHHAYDLLDKPAGGWAEAWRIHRAAAEGLRTGADSASVPLAACPATRRLAIQEAEGQVRIVTAPTGAAPVTLEQPRGRLRQATFSPDGRRLAIHGRTGTLGLWDADDGRLIAMLGDQDDRFEAFLFSPDGGRLAAVKSTRNRQQEVWVYDAIDGRRLSAVTAQRRQGLTDSLFAFSPHGDRLVTNWREHELQVWDVARAARLDSLKGRTGIATALAVSPDDRQIAAGFTDGTIRLWNADTASVDGELMGHDGAITSLAFHPDGHSLASGAHDGTVRIWSRTAAEPLGTLADHAGMTAAAFRPDGRQLAVAPRDGGGIELWDPRTVERRHRLPGPAGLVTEIAYSPDGTLVAAAFRNADQAGEVRVWTSDAGELVATLGDIGRGAERVGFAPDGSRLLTTAADATVTVWNPRTGERLMSTASRYEGAFIDAAAVFGLDGSRVAYRMAALLDAATGDVVASLRPQGHVTCLAASPDGLTLATGLAIGAVNFADFATGRPGTRLLGHAGPVRAIAFSRDGTRIATGSEDGSARVWNACHDPTSGATVCVFNGHESAVETVLFSPDGRRVVTASRDETVRIWDVESGQELCTLPAPRDFPRAVVLSPDGTLLVTAATAAGGLRIWGLSNAAVVSARRAAAARH
jgi:WD40 repeat protein